jgi:hypothetical protein
VDAREIDAATLGIAPAQTLCELTLDRLAVVSGDGLPGSAEAGRLQVYARETTCPANLRDSTIVLTVTFRANERGGRWWVVGRIGGG